MLTAERTLDERYESVHTAILAGPDAEVQVLGRLRSGLAAGGTCGPHRDSRIAQRCRRAAPAAVQRLLRHHGAPATATSRMNRARPARWPTPRPSSTPIGRVGPSHEGHTCPRALWIEKP